MPRLKALQEFASYQKFSDGNLTGEQLLAARERIKAGMKLSAADAQSFADKTFDALAFVRSNYIKKLNLGEMTANGIKGLYRVTETVLPEELKEKLAKAKDLTDKDVKELLRNARNRSVTGKTWMTTRTSGLPCGPAWSSSWTITPPSSIRNG